MASSTSRRSRTETGHCQSQSGCSPRSASLTSTAGCLASRRTTPPARTRRTRSTSPTTCFWRRRSSSCAERRAAARPSGRRLGLRRIGTRRASRSLRRRRKSSSSRRNTARERSTASTARPLWRARRSCAPPSPRCFQTRRRTCHARRVSARISTVPIRSGRLRSRDACCVEVLKRVCAGGRCCPPLPVYAGSLLSAVPGAAL
mmetsp:Transcript_57360/g.131647  ORF Transcript_57360/g.131647 Transcript_57360/m.131647 type:complete len:203 (-) Transcript_57360:143-751(-)